MNYVGTVLARLQRVEMPGNEFNQPCGSCGEGAWRTKTGFEVDRG
jgi:hypothetical protein